MLGGKERRGSAKRSLHPLGEAGAGVTSRSLQGFDTGAKLATAKPAMEVDGLCKAQSQALEVPDSVLPVPVTSRRSEVAVTRRQLAPVLRQGT